MEAFLHNLGARLPAVENSTPPKRRRRYKRRRPTPEHLAALARQTRKIKAFKAALIAAGYDTVSAQAEVLGLSRSTAWAALNAEHEGAGFSSSTVKRMLLSSKLPPAVRRIVEEYVTEKLKGLYGQSKQRLRVFRRRIGATLVDSPASHGE
jgi:hypothetical protein